MRTRGITAWAVSVVVVAAVSAYVAVAITRGGDGGTGTGTTASAQVYVALGDSFSSGDGNPATESVSSGACLRSKQGWAYRLPALTSRALTTTDLACPGAQASALTGSFLGQEPQLTAMTALRPSLVTITIGGNDVGFVPGMIDCYLSDCVNDGTLATGLDRVQQVEPLAAKLYAGVKDAAPDDATVVVVGYPDLFGSGTAVGCPWLSATEQEDIIKLQELLDTQFAAAAQSAGVRYVSLRHAFKGHEMCTSEPWLNPVTSKQTPAHPNSAGQAAMAKGVQAALADVLPSK